MARPQLSEHHPYHARYIDLVQGNSIQEIVENYAYDLQEFYNDLPEDKADYAYAENKWTLKQVMQHVTDAERIFAYRALRISRSDSTPLASFDENAYVANGFSTQRYLSSLKQEFNAVRAATDIFLLSLNQKETQRSGTVANTNVSVNALAFLIYGHLLHHKNIFITRYGL